MIPCSSCGKNLAARAVGLCPDCFRKSSLDKISLDSHFEVRKKFGLPETPPRNAVGLKCNFCANECSLGPEERGYCGLRKNIDGKIKNDFAENSCLAYMYLDPLPTNCCAAWFCQGSKQKGFNLAVFFYGCSFNCLFCQNYSHKNLKEASLLSEEQIVKAALKPEVRCVCFFGGSPEPQLPFAIKVSRRILKETNNKKHICWEWNGCGNPGLVKKAAELSLQSKGTVKFDLKAFHPNLARALCGTSLSRSYENFSMLAKLYPKENLLTATTLLVPYYVDKKEVREIARFISKENADIPYSLLVFHPDFIMNDMPVTPRRQAEECFLEARSYLSNVYLGNRHLLGI